jgi:hypothetical protein
LHLCTNIVNNSNLTEDTDIDNELNIPALSAADLIILLQSFTILLTVTIIVF